MSIVNDIYNIYLFYDLVYIQVVENMNILDDSSYKYKYLQGKGSSKMSKGGQTVRQIIKLCLDVVIDLRFIW